MPATILANMPKETTSGRPSRHRCGKNWRQTPHLAVGFPAAQLTPPALLAPANGSAGRWRSRKSLSRRQREPIGSVGLATSCGSRPPATIQPRPAGDASRRGRWPRCRRWISAAGRQCVSLGQVCAHFLSRCDGAPCPLFSQPRILSRSAISVFTTFSRDSRPLLAAVPCLLRAIGTPVALKVGQWRGRFSATTESPE